MSRLKGIRVGSLRVLKAITPPMNEFQIYASKEEDKLVNQQPCRPTSSLSTPFRIPSQPTLADNSHSHQTMLPIRARTRL